MSYFLPAVQNYLSLIKQRIENLQSQVENQSNQNVSPMVASTRFISNMREDSKILGFDSGVVPWEEEIKEVWRILRSYPMDHSFYVFTSKNENLNDLLAFLVYYAIHQLSAREALDRIKSTNFKDTLFLIIYRDVMNLVKGLQSYQLKVTKNDTGIVFDNNGSNIDDFLDGLWGITKVVNNNLKINTAESIGLTMFSRDFGIRYNTNKENSRIIIQHPFGTSSFPDFMVDLYKTKDRGESIRTRLGLTDESQRYLLVDTKATVTKSLGLVNIRLRYPKAGDVNRFCNQIGLEPLFREKDEPSYEIKLPVDKFKELIKFYINMSYANPRSQVNKLLNFAEGFQILYQELGTGAKKTAKYDLIEYPETGGLIFKKHHEAKYSIETSDGTTLVDLMFYLNDDLKKRLKDTNQEAYYFALGSKRDLDSQRERIKGDEEYQKDLADFNNKLKIYTKTIEKLMPKGMPSDQKKQNVKQKAEEALSEDAFDLYTKYSKYASTLQKGNIWRIACLNLEDDQIEEEENRTSNYTKAVKDNISQDYWAFMWRWNVGSLKNIKMD